MARYKQKLSDIGITDPYLVPEVVFHQLVSVMDDKMVPNLEYPDLINYLVFQPSPYTGQSMKAY